MVALIGLVTLLHLSASGISVKTSLILCHPSPHELLVSGSALFQFLIHALACFPMARTEGTKPRWNIVREVEQGLKPLAYAARAAMLSNFSR